MSNFEITEVILLLLLLLQLRSQVSPSVSVAVTTQLKESTKPSNTSTLSHCPCTAMSSRKGVHVLQEVLDNLKLHLAVESERIDNYCRLVEDLQTEFLQEREVS